MSTERKASPKPKARTKTTRTRTATKKRTSTVESKLDATKRSLSLMALSPYRFPLDVQKLALQGVRVGSLAFVFIGVLLSYNYLESAMTGVVMDATQAAQVTSAIVCANECLADDQTPPVEFAYESSLNAQLVRFIVPEATSVTVHAYDVVTGTYMKLGAARNVKADTWEYVWLTDNVAPGNYWIKAVVTNGYGMYDRSDSTFVTVK